MKITRKILLSLAVALVLGLGGVAWSDFSGGHGHMRSGGTPGIASPQELSSLGITDAQKAKFKELTEKYKASTGPLVRKFAAERRDMWKLIHSGTVDDAAIRAQAAKMADTGAILAVDRAHFFADLRKAFTPEQIRKVEETLSKSEGRMDMALGRIAREVVKR